MSPIKSLLTLSLTSSLVFAKSDDHNSDEATEDLLADSPNVILIIADNLGYGDFSFLGDAAVQTPALDQLAANSARWENFYVSPIGALTRSSLYTGRYSTRTKVLGSGNGVAIMAEDELTLPEVMTANGYKTGIFGTWNLGDNYPARATDQGFQKSLLHRGSGLGQASDVISEDKEAITLLSNNYEANFIGDANDIFFDEAEKFIKQAKKHDASFFVTISPTHYTPESLTNPSSDSTTTQSNTQALQANKTDFIKNFDRNLGELTELLSTEKLTENTIIVVLSDNGPQFPNTASDSTLRGSMGQIYEGAMRSPLLISWPKVIKQGFTVTDNVAAHIDVMPTILHACGYGVEDAFDYDGRTLLEKIKDPSLQLPERTIAQQWHAGDRLSKYHHFMVRKGDWKLVNPSDPTKTRAESRDYELYHLAADPKEQRNLADEQKEKVQELEKAYADWLRDVTETRLRDAAPNYILIDRERENPVVLTWQDRNSRAAGFNNPGFWKLDFEHSGRADVQVEFPSSFSKDLTGWKATLTIGKQKLTHTVRAGEIRHFFNGVNFTKGRHHLRCTFSAPDGSETLSAYQVRILHR